MHAVGTHYIHREYAVCKHLLHCILCAQSMHNSAVCSADKVPLTTAPHTVQEMTQPRQIDCVFV